MLAGAKEAVDRPVGVEAFEGGVPVGEGVLVVGVELVEGVPPTSEGDVTGFSGEGALGEEEGGVDGEALALWMVRA